MSIKMRMPKLASVRGQTLLTDSTPYLFRQSPVVTEMLDDMLTGGTVAWNQLWNQPNTLTAPAGVNTGSLGVSYNIPFVAGHKYLQRVKQNATMSSNTRNTFAYNDGTNHFQTTSANNHLQAGDMYWVFSASASTNSGSVWVWVHTPNVDVSYSGFGLTDLTQMFGSTIADYVYSLETQTAGSGIAWLKSFGFFGKDYYPYDAGSLLSVKTSAHETVKGGITHTYPLSDIELRGVPKLQDGQIVYDGDTYESDGTVTRRFGIVDLGTLSWVKSSAGNMFYSTSSRGVPHYSMGDTVMLCPEYVFDGAVTASPYYGADRTLRCWRYNSPESATYELYIHDERYSDANAFATAMNGVLLLYEMRYSTTETTDAFTNPQQAGSTEEYIDERTVPMPVGHVTEYFNMIQKEQIQMHMGQAQAIKMHMPKGD